MKFFNIVFSIKIYFSNVFCSANKENMYILLFAIEKICSVVKPTPEFLKLYFILFPLWLLFIFIMETFPNLKSLLFDASFSTIFWISVSLVLYLLFDVVLFDLIILITIFSWKVSLIFSFGDLNIVRNLVWSASLFLILIISHPFGYMVVKFSLLSV